MICEICGKEFDKPQYHTYDKICGDKDCFTKKFWLSIIEEKKYHPVINGVCYYCDVDNPISDSRGFRGFGGRYFKIRFIDTGKIIETNNLCHNGDVPKEFRDQLPDNAEFIQEELNIGDNICF